jgi:hypothetical protein
LTNTLLTLEAIDLTVARTEAAAFKNGQRRPDTIPENAFPVGFEIGWFHRFKQTCVAPSVLRKFLAVNGTFQFRSPSDS